MSARTAARHRAESPLPSVAPAAKVAAAIATGSMAATIAIPAFASTKATAAPVAHTAPLPALTTPQGTTTTFGEMRFTAQTVARPAVAATATSAKATVATPAPKAVVRALKASLMAAPKASRPTVHKVVKVVKKKTATHQTVVKKTVHVTVTKRTAVKRVAAKHAPVKHFTAKHVAAKHVARKHTTVHGSRGGVGVSRSAPRTSITPSRHQHKSHSIIDLAQRYSGIWYVWGGTTPSGFDCSGFVQFIHDQLGISLPRTAEEQRQMTHRVSDPRPGDLVFFGFPAHHVGIYAGDGMMYDSPRTGKQSGLHKIWSLNVTFGRL